MSQDQREKREPGRGCGREGLKAAGGWGGQERETEVPAVNPRFAPRVSLAGTAETLPALRLQGAGWGVGSSSERGNRSHTRGFFACLGPCLAGPSEPGVSDS